MKFRKGTHVRLKAGVAKIWQKYKSKTGYVQYSPRSEILTISWDGLLTPQRWHKDAFVVIDRELEK